MKIACYMSAIIIGVFFGVIPSFAFQTIISKKVINPPAIDGEGNDPTWKSARAITTHDKRGGD